MSVSLSVCLFVNFAFIEMLTHLKICLEINVSYIENGQIKCFYFYLLGWGLRVIYNSDIFEN